MICRIVMIVMCGFQQTYREKELEMGRDYCSMQQLWSFKLISFSLFCFFFFIYIHFVIYFTLLFSHFHFISIVSICMSMCLPCVFIFYSFHFIIFGFS